MDNKIEQSVIACNDNAISGFSNKTYCIHAVDFFDETHKKMINGLAQMRRSQLESKFLTLAEKFLENVKELHRKYGEDCSIEITVRSNNHGG